MYRFVCYCGVFVSAGIIGSNPAFARTLTILDNHAEAWAQVEVQRPGDPAPLESWSQYHLGPAEANLYISQMGLIAGYTFYSGTASASIGPDIPGGYEMNLNPVFSLHIVADDWANTHSRAGVVTEWKFSVGDDPVGFDALAWAEMGLTSGFRIDDLTNNATIYDSGTVRTFTRRSDTFRAQHTYRLLAFGLAEFAGGDGSAGFSFGVDADVIFGDAPTAASIPEPATLGLLAIGMTCLQRKRRRLSAA